MKRAIRTLHTKSYADRTRFNVAHSDITIAFVFNRNSAGTKKTRQIASGTPYIEIDAAKYHPIDAAHKICKKLYEWKLTNILVNIAGNSLRTISKLNLPDNIDQFWCNNYVYATLKEVINCVGDAVIAEIISGGQTGFDFAGLVAAHKLGIDYSATFPAQYRQISTIDGTDMYQFTDGAGVLLNIEYYSAKINQENS